MSRKDDLEQSIRESEDLINQYQAIIRESSDPKERARPRREIEEQQELVKGYRAELETLAKGGGTYVDGSVEWDRKVYPDC